MRQRTTPEPAGPLAGAVATAAPPTVAPAGPEGLWRKGADLLLIAVFLLTVSLPGLSLLLRLPGARVLPRLEPPTPFPVIALTRQALRAFPAGFAQYFSRSLGYRAALLRQHSLLKVGALHVSSSEDVILGRDGWLYLGAYNERDCTRHARPFTRAELEQWRRLLERRRDWVTSRGGKFVFVVAPDKHTIYPEHLPASFTPLHRESRLDQLAAYLRRTSDVPFLDLRPALRAEKAHHEIYYPLDTHWNDIGAFIAHREICRALRLWFPRVQLPSLDGYRIRVTPGRSGDLPQLLGLRRTDMPGPWVRLVPKTPRQADVVVSRPRDPRHPNLVTDEVITERTGAPVPRAVILRDSFALALQPFLSELFDRSVYLWTNQLDKEVISRERPDVVIWELVERDLYLPPPSR